MKYISILVSLMLVACASSKMVNKYSVKNVLTYEVYKIDSINTYYLIYAKKSDSLYKIVSKKEEIHNGNRIRLKGKYPLNLHSRLSEFRIGNVVISPKTSNINCFAFDKETNICLEGDSIKDLYSADNIRGIYFIKMKK